jgi:hypothetical protein
MQTDTHNQQATVVLKDGNIPLATWTESFHRTPTVGERLNIPAEIMKDLKGYDPRAIVSGIRQSGDLAEVIELEATCQTQMHERPVIVVNSNRIPESLRRTAEAHLRSTLRFPIIQWEPSVEPDPVVRFHDPVSGRKACPQDVRSGLLDLLYAPASA